MTNAFAGLTPCVHCGFCLQSCPTFLVTGDEADGPRGRIVLMQALERGRLAATDPGLRLHLDRCLGCRACEPVCPSGVVYGPALEAARDQIARARPVPWLARLVLTVMAVPVLRRMVFGLARVLRPFAPVFVGKGRLGFAMGMLAATRPVGRFGGRAVGRSGGRNLQGVTEPNLRMVTARPTGPPDRPTAVFEGCIQRELFGHVNAAAARTLAVNGYRVVNVPEQDCCGALHAHAGLHAEAVLLARRNVRAFAAAPDVLVAVTAAGCGAMLKSYGALLADDPMSHQAAAFAARVQDVTELLAAAGPRAGAAVPLCVAYDPPCHLIHAQRVDDAPRQVLDAVPGLAVVGHDEAELCCGSAGIYSLTEFSMSQAVLERKLDALDAAAPEAVVTGNPGCAMQIGAGLAARGRRIPVLHPVEILDWAYQAMNRTSGARRSSLTSAERLHSTP